MKKPLNDNFWISVAFDKENVTKEQREMIRDIFTATFLQCVGVNPASSFTNDGEKTIFQAEVPAHFIVNAKMILYALFESCGIKIVWNYEID